jgi:hypothetical protein
VKGQRVKSNLVVSASLLVSFFAIPHLIDDFLFEIPLEFGLTNPVAQALGGLFTVLLILSIVLAAKNTKAGYYACFSIGLLLVLAATLKHIPRMVQPGPYWSGLFSEFLIYGLIASSLLLSILSISAILSHDV